VFYTYTTHEGKNYKLMIDVGSYADIITKTALEKMGLKAEPHLHPYNMNWVDKTTQSIIQNCQVHIHMSSYNDRVWCDVLDIDAAHILLGRPCLYDLDVTSLGRSNTYEFKFKEKNNVETCQSKSSIGNNREGTITEKNNKTPYYLVTRSHFSPESLLMGLLLSLGIPSDFSPFT